MAQISSQDEPGTMKKMIKNLLTQETGFAMMIVVGFMALAVPLLTSALALGGALSKDSLIKFSIAKNQYSSAAGREYISFLSDDPTTWDDWIDNTGGLESFTINDDTVEITGDRNGASDNGALAYCIFGATSVEIEENASVLCSIASNGDIELEDGASVTGNVVSGGNVTLENNATVNGDVTAAGTVTLDTGASVTGTITENAGWTPITGPTPNYDVTITVTDQDGNETVQTFSVDGGALPLSFILAAGGTDVTVPSSGSYAATPGSYGTLKVEENATISFVSGNYAFDDIEFDENVTINLTILGGPIVIDVVNDLDFDEHITMNVIGGTAADIVFRVQDEVSFDEYGQYVGTYFTGRSPGGQFGQGESTILTGALLGGDVEVEEGSTVVGMPSIGAYLSFFE